MCDTLVALPNATADGSLLFAKNSDREPNEAHHLLVVPAANYAPGELVQCTYLAIPQVTHTHAILLAKPFWIWGAEMGANEFGVVIGNEAVFTRAPYDKAPGLIGMDFLRLALERAADAHSALEVITSLLAIHGQGGNCGLAHPFYYHNSFLIADLSQAWILETVGKQWAARQVKDIGSISNALTLGSEWDLASPDLVNYAVDQGWCKQRDHFNFARDYSDFLYTRFSAASSRQSCTIAALHSQRGRLTVPDLMAILRSHRSPQANWSPGPAVIGADVCMHAGWGPIRGSQSAGSLVSHIAPGLQTHWVTGTSAPCTSIFKPVWLDAGLPDIGPQPDGTFCADNLWWQHEKLHRAVLRNYPARLQSFAASRDRLEAQFFADSRVLNTASPADRRAYSEKCFHEAAQAEHDWLEGANAIPPHLGWAFYYRQAWSQWDRHAKMSEEYHG